MIHPVSFYLPRRMLTGRSNFRSALLLVSALVLARVIFIAFMPGTYSNDLRAWVEVVRVMDEGENPYTTGLVNWPPLWPGILYGLGWIASITGLGLITGVQIFLIAIDAINLLLARDLAQRMGAGSRITKVLLIGLVLNPISILLTVQHGNFDALVCTWLLLFIRVLSSFIQTGERASWYGACFFLGLGVLTKTIPFLLAPLLFIGPWKNDLRVALTGLALFLGPVVLTMLPFFLLDPESIWQHVIRYRSYAGWFGITGLGQLIGADVLVNLYTRGAPIIFLGLMFVAGVHVLRRGISGSGQLLRLTLIMLLSIVVLGPGYSPQCIGWYLPLLVLLFSDGDRREQRILATGLIVAVMTYLVEYALVPSHGAFLLPANAFWVAGFSERFSQPEGQTLLRLPLFVMYGVLLLALIDRLRRTPGSPMHQKV